MDAVFSRWTRAHTLCLVTFVTLIPGLALASAVGEPLTVLAAAVVVALIWTVGFITSPLVGLFGGIAGAVALSLLRPFDAGLSALGIAPMAVMTVSLLAGGLYAGLAGRRLRWHSRPVFLPEPSVDPNDSVLGPHGFLNAEYGLVRLEEELNRAKLFARPLSILRLHSEPAGGDPATEKEMVTDATRTLARLVEGTLRETDIPFAPSDHELICLLPETDGSRAEMLLSLVQDLVDDADVPVPKQGRTVLLTSVVNVQLGVASLTDDATDAEGLLSEVRSHDSEAAEEGASGGGSGVRAEGDTYANAAREENADAAR